MAANVISIGVPTILVQNVEYALPARLCHVISTHVMDVSVNGVAWSALTNVNTTGAYSGAAYIRCTTGTPTVLCKVH